MKSQKRVKVVSEYTAEVLKKEEIKSETNPSILLMGNTTDSITYKRLSPLEIEDLLLMHPLIPRGIEIWINRVIAPGYNVKPFAETDTAKEASDYCKQIIENSGGQIFVKELGQAAKQFGNSFGTFVLNQLGNEVKAINIEHPVYFGIAKYPSTEKDKNLKGKPKIDSVTKEPIAYTQLYYDQPTHLFKPIGKEIPADLVIHLYFDRYGDEPEGISVVQYLYKDIRYLLNMEEAAAENIYRTGFTQKKVTTDIKTEKGLREIGKNLREINSKDSIILPGGTDVTNLTPGNSQFTEFHSKFMDLCALRIGVPKPILMLSGTDSNKSTLDEMMKDMRNDLVADGQIISQAITNQVFVSACKIKYGEDFKEIPEFVFNEMEEDKNRTAERLRLIAEATSYITKSHESLINTGKKEEAAMLLNTMLKELEKISK